MAFYVHCRQSTHLFCSITLQCRRIAVFKRTSFCRLVCSPVNARNWHKIGVAWHYGDVLWQLASKQVCVAQSAGPTAEIVNFQIAVAVVAYELSGRPSAAWLQQNRRRYLWYSTVTLTSLPITLIAAERSIPVEKRARNLLSAHSYSILAWDRW